MFHFLLINSPLMLLGLHFPAPLLCKNWIVHLPGKVLCIFACCDPPAIQNYLNQTRIGYNPAHATGEQEFYPRNYTHILARLETVPFLPQHFYFHPKKPPPTWRRKNWIVCFHQKNGTPTWSYGSWQPHFNSFQKASPHTTSLPQNRNIQTQACFPEATKSYFTVTAVMFWSPLSSKQELQEERSHKVKPFTGAKYFCCRLRLSFARALMVTPALLNGPTKRLVNSKTASPPGAFVRLRRL